MTIDEHLSYLTPSAARVLDLLNERPHRVAELMIKANLPGQTKVIERLEQHKLIQPPTQRGGVYVLTENGEKVYSYLVGIALLTTSG